MRKFMAVLAAGWLMAAGIVLSTDGDAVAVRDKQVNVVIEYGNGRPARTVKAAVTPGETVLGVLQTVATVDKKK